MPARKSQDRGQNTPEKKTKEPKGHITERPLIYATIHDGEDPLKVNQAVSPVRPGELVQVIQRKRKLSKSPSNIVSTQLPPSKELENTPQNRGGPVQGMTKTPKQKSNRVKEKSSGPRQTRLSNNGLGHPARVKKCKRTSVVRDQAPGNCAASEISGPTKHHKPLDTRVDKKFKLKQTRLDVATEIFPDKPRQNAWTPPEGSVLENPSKFTTGKLSSDQVDSLFSVSPDADISEPPPLGSRSLLLNKYDNHDADEDRKSFKEIKMEQPKLAERKCHIEGAVSSSKKPRLLRTCQKNRILSTDEQDTGSQVEELEDEIKMLDAGKVLAKRTRDESSRNKALSNRQRLLATLRNKRKGIAPSNTDNYDVDSSTDSQPLYDSTSEKSSGSVNSENFIVESEDEDFDSTQMPVEFQMQSHQKLSHHFKVLVQYEVHRLLNPAMNLDQNYFQLALKAFEKKVDSIRDSVLISTAWKHNFSSAIKARPIFSDAESNTGMRCDACNITNRYHPHFQP
ncbi:hypothetical protein NEOLI_000603 [Neolecta irregularis DAH-3]|uniref:DUF4211 domain-containing protein n=1 Tax=Neolecta irregularis (strain DAH-3) TaxID=1198029 RepID=A0A1U7LR91_NEOID|nr:hypothetical protein NEOLI_000603 [Neolecta irregularis DAH-3]|eukprot:OLL25149.1 hypothetical protein NEOLI_000603 [Neolecta irregularis DAH-3]